MAIPVRFKIAEEVGQDEVASARRDGRH
ncbi:MAG: hypothetical protein RL385_4129, partial [Pseudomonadota bacterium]